MTYQEFKHSDYRIDTAAWYAAIDAEPAAGVRDALIHHITEYKMLDAIRTLEASKAKNKPLHYKAVKGILETCADDRIRVHFSLEWFAKTMRAKFDYQYDVNRLYLNIGDDNILDWNSPINGEFVPRTIEDIRKAVGDIVKLNNKLKDDINALKKKYNDDISPYSDIHGVARLWVNVKS